MFLGGEHLQRWLVVVCHPVPVCYASFFAVTMHSHHSCLVVADGFAVVEMGVCGKFYLEMRKKSITFVFNP